MPIAFAVYTACWIVACLIAVAVAVVQRRHIELLHGAYWRFLATPWRLSTFFVAALSLIVVAPHTGDPTWDYVDATFMSVLAFTTAPWVVGTLYRSQSEGSVGRVFVALCVWLFSASWSYDLYIYVRDGNYPLTWLSNIFASSVLYVSAGLFWSLEHRPRRGATFSFMEPEWLVAADSGEFKKVFWYAMPFMAIVAATIVYFVATA